VAAERVKDAYVEHSNKEGNTVLLSNGYMYTQQMVEQEADETM
jgi:hypothetical protein